MKQEFRKAVKEAKKIMYKIEDPAHNLIHVKSVVKSAKKIARKYIEVDIDLIETAAWWHDVGRIHLDQGHEKISAEMLSKYLANLKFEKEICKKAYESVAFHKWSMQPKTIEGEIVRDADKLDFISISRWKSCLKNNEIKTLKDISILLPKLRNEILHLEISKEIYDKKIIKFKKFILKNKITLCLK